MQKGDIVQIEYEIWIKGAKNELFETNIEKVARDNGKFAEDEKYAPMPVVVGFERQMKVLEESLLKGEVGKDYELEIKPADGAGERDPNKVKLFPLREIYKLPEFQKKDAKPPEVGMDIVVDGKIGAIVGIYTGRARVDFNHKLAGKTLNYKYRVIKKADDPDERVKSMIEISYGTSKDFSVSSDKDGAVTIILPDVCKYDNKWFLAKYKLVADLRDLLGIKLTRFIEEYRKKEEEKPAEGHEGHDHPHEEEKPEGEKKPAKEKKKAEDEE